ncbi:MAG TPA: MBL fold metallo-hydrolase [Candidatus Paceibacterota bacterium]
MKLTKYGHCCLLIEVNNKRILTDPGKFSDGFGELTGIDLIVITHEHADHFHSAAVIHILEKNPQAQVVTNSSVGKLLAELGVTHEVLEGDTTGECAGVALHAIDGRHAEIYEDFGQVQNTGFMIEHTFFYPGDAYIVPSEKVEILALPVAGPWCKVSEALRYGLDVKPQLAIPVHDAVLSEEGKNVVYPFFNRMLGEAGITFTPLTHGETKEFGDRD